MAKSNTKRGFVLIEVLVAVGVASLILVALLRAFINTWYGIGLVREEAEAVMIARTLLTAVTPRENATDTSQQGNIGRYSWRLAMQKAPLPVPVETGTPTNANSDTESDDNTNTPFAWTLYRVAVEVTGPSGRRTTLETSRLSRP